MFKINGKAQPVIKAVHEFTTRDGTKYTLTGDISLIPVGSIITHVESTVIIQDMSGGEKTIYKQAEFGRWEVSAGENWWQSSK